MFTQSDIRARIKQQPFVPVRIITSSGQMLDVYHPDLIMAGKRELIIGTAAVDDPSTFEGITRLSILHITALQDLPVPATPSGNGPLQSH